MYYEDLQGWKHKTGNGGEVFHKQGKGRLKREDSRFGVESNML